MPPNWVGLERPDGKRNRALPQGGQAVRRESAGRLGAEKGVEVVAAAVRRNETHRSRDRTDLVAEEVRHLLKAIDDGTLEEAKKGELEALESRREVVP